MSALVKAVPGLVAAVLGVLLAYLWFNMPEIRWLPIAVVVVLAVLGWLFRRYGKSRIRTNPIGSIVFLEAWALTVLALGAAGAAVAIVLAVFLSDLTPDGTPSATKELLSAAVAAVTAFSAAVLIKGLDDFGEELGKTIAGAFVSALQQCVPATPEGAATEEYRALYSSQFGGEEGWDRKARRVRAAALVGACST